MLNMFYLHFLCSLWSRMIDSLCGIWSTSALIRNPRFHGIQGIDFSEFRKHRTWTLCFGLDLTQVHVYFRHFLSGHVFSIHKHWFLTWTHIVKSADVCNVTCAHWIHVAFVCNISTYRCIFWAYGWKYVILRLLNTYAAKSWKNHAPLHVSLNNSNAAGMSGLLQGQLLGVYVSATCIIQIFVPRLTKWGRGTIEFAIVCPSVCSYQMPQELLTSRKSPLYYQGREN